MAHAITDLPGATRLARAVAWDLAFYHAGVIEQSLRDGRPFVGLEQELLEARSLYVRRVAVGLDPVPVLVRVLQDYFGSIAANWGVTVEGLAEAIATTLERGRDRLALCIVDGAREPGRILPLGDGVQEIGRTAPVDLEIAEPSIAPRHARVLVDGAHVKVEDIESSGIVVNGERARSATLTVGDRLELGDVGLTLIRVAAVETVVESTQPDRGDLGRTMDRKAIVEALRAALGRGGPLALVLCDLDHIDRIDAGHGHTVGDELRKAIAARITVAAHAQQGFVIGRHDGAFVVLLPGQDALEQAEELRLAVTRDPVDTHDGPMHASLSIGVTAHPDVTASTPEVWLTRAQAAIQAARESGRHGVVSAS